MRRLGARERERDRERVDDYPNDSIWAVGQNMTIPRPPGAIAECGLCYKDGLHDDL